MVLNRNGRKMRHPYAKIAVLSLAATGVASIISKGKKFIKKKKECIVDMIDDMKS